jgi:hypothetical protein
MTKTKPLTATDLVTLQKAKKKMEEIGWAMQGLNKIGNVIEDKVALLPKKKTRLVSTTKLQSTAYCGEE